jgi:ubiquinone/menaquinone biosynthesis C-methylase UbiE
MQLDQMSQIAKALSDDSRLRLLALCNRGELTVSDLVKITGLSQPRTSRHLNILQDLGLLESFRERHFIYYRGTLASPHKQIVNRLLQSVDEDDPILVEDARHWRSLQAERSALAETYVEAEIPDWLELHQYHGDSTAFAEHVSALLKDHDVGHILDIATGTGRMLCTVGKMASSGYGVDLSDKMVIVARNAIETAKLNHLSVRKENMYALRFPAEVFDTITIDQVLYFADRPADLFTEAARVLKSSGQLLVVAFTAHDKASQDVAITVDIRDIINWLADAKLSVEQIDKIPGDSLDISLILASKVQ